MHLVAEKLQMADFNTTENAALFSNPKYGALYIAPENDFEENPQKTLSEILKLNQSNPVDGINIKRLEVTPDEIFLKKSFKDLDEAERFIINFFIHFKLCLPQHYEGIIKKLRNFVKLSNSDKEVHCRLEVLSGDSCRKFHVDNVKSRLIYTCAGPGSQIKHPSKDEFITLPSGSALVVKGFQYPDFKLATLHRSPPIAKNKIKRLLFVVDYL